TPAHNGENINACWGKPIVHHVRKPMQQRRSHISITRGVALRKLPNPVERLVEFVQEFVAQALPTRFVPIACLGRVLLGFRAEDQRQGHFLFRKRSRTSSHGVPADGSASAAARRWSSNSRCASGISKSLGLSVFQMSSINRNRSSGLMRSIPRFL